MPDLTHLTHDEDRWVPDPHLIGKRLYHTGNGKTYQIFGFCWLGDTDRWGYLHAEVRLDGLPGVTIARPMAHLDGRRSNGERRYTFL